MSLEAKTGKKVEFQDDDARKAGKGMRIWISILIATVAFAGELEESGLRQLLVVRRVFVDRLTGGETAAQMRELLVSSLDNAKLFVSRRIRIELMRSFAAAPKT